MLRREKSVIDCRKTGPPNLVCSLLGDTPRIRIGSNNEFLIRSLHPVLPPFAQENTTTKFLNAILSFSYEEKVDHVPSRARSAKNICAKLV
jgi:hypothetical protein